MDTTFKIFLLFLLPFFNPIQAQIHYQVVPGNSNQVSYEIFQDFGPLIDISSAQLSAHLGGLVNPNTYCPPCPTPYLQFQQPTPNDLLLTWAAIPNASYYEIAYINLQNGSSGTFTETNTHWPWNNLPDAAYAFSITGHGVNSDVAFSTAADIIIMDTPILIDEYVYNCDCQINIATSLTIDDSTITWNPELDQRYKFQLTFLDGTNCEIILRTKDSGEPDYPYDFALECVDFLEYSDASNTFFSESGSSDFTIHLEYDEQYLFEFDAEDNPLVSASLIHCQSQTPPEDNKTHKISPVIKNSKKDFIQLYPNPAQEEINLTHNFDHSLTGTVLIYDALGKLIYSEAVDGKHFIVNIAQWPAGRYEVQFITTEDFVSKSFMKMN